MSIAQQKNNSKKLIVVIYTFIHLYIYTFIMDEDLLLKVLFTSLLRENFWIMVIVNLDYERFFRIVYNLILLEFPELDSSS